MWKNNFAHVQTKGKVLFHLLMRPANLNTGQKYVESWRNTGSKSKIKYPGNYENYFWVFSLNFAYLACVSAISLRSDQLTWLNVENRCN